METEVNWKDVNYRKPSHVHGAYRHGLNHLLRTWAYGFVPRLLDGMPRGSLYSMILRRRTARLTPLIDQIKGCKVFTARSHPYPLEVHPIAQHGRPL